jgi:hypothetical protein
MFNPQIDLDAPLVGAEKIAAAAGWFIARGKRKGKPNTAKVYYKHEVGLLSGIVHKNGRDLISSLRQIQSLATRNIPVQKTE